MPARKTEDPLLLQAGRYLGIGMTWALSTALFLYLGMLADKKAGTEPVLTLIGALVGSAAGLYYLIHTLAADAGKRQGRSQERDETK